MTVRTVSLGFAATWQVWYDPDLRRYRWSASCNGVGEGGSELHSGAAEAVAKAALERLKSEQR